MKYFLLLFIFINLNRPVSFSQNNEVSSSNEVEALSIKNVTFLGVNFSKFRLLNSFGFIDKNGKTKCAALKFKYFRTWNEIFLIEKAKFNPTELLLLKEHTISIDWSLKLNENIDVDNCIITNLSYKISEKDIQNIVNEYVGHVVGKIGVLIVAESMSKKLGEGAHIIVYFDIKSGKILLHKRYVASPTGYGFNNYWVNTIHKCLEQHENYVKKTRKKLKLKN